MRYEIGRQKWFAYGEADGVVEALELQVSEAPGRPRARVGDVEVVPPRHGGEAGLAVPGHEAPEGRRRPVEGAGVGDLVERRPRHLTHQEKQSTEHMDVSQPACQKDRGTNQTRLMIERFLG